MCTALILSPPTARAMSYRSVVLVTTLSCPAARLAGTSSASATMTADATLRNIFSMFSTLHDKRRRAAARRKRSERMWLVWSQREARLQQNAIDPVRARRTVPLIGGDQFRELAWEPFEIPGASG